VIRKSRKLYPIANNTNRGLRPFRESQRTFDQTQQLHQAGRIEDVVTYFKRTRALRPKSPGDHNKLRVMQSPQGRVLDAVDNYQRALRIRQGDPNIHNNLGLALAARGRFADAVSQYERALVLDPDHAGAL
jgi:Flp pilus assembly protein TadD